MNIIEKKTIEFKDWYDQHLSHHNAAVHFFSDLISSIPEVKSVAGRVKIYDECISKFKRKYLPQIPAEDTSFQIKNHLTDLIGIRAVCFYSDEVQEIRRHLKKYFREIEYTDKSEQLEKTDNKFGYKSLHIQLMLKNRLKGIDEAETYKNLIIELQIRTVIQDAWGILDHKIKYKKSIPHNLKRRINRLSALFEIADDEFMSIQHEISLQESNLNKRLKRGGKIEKTKALDVFRFLFVALKFFPKYNFIEYKVDGFVQELLLNKTNFTEGELNEALQLNLSSVDDLEKKNKQQLNPYTKIRYCLYKTNKKQFKDILSRHQQEIFRNWQEEE